MKKTKEQIENILGVKKLNVLEQKTIKGGRAELIARYNHDIQHCSNCHDDHHHHHDVELSLDSFF